MMNLVDTEFYDYEIFDYIDSWTNGWHSFWTPKWKVSNEENCYNDGTFGAFKLMIDNIGCGKIYRARFIKIKKKAQNIFFMETIY